MLTEAGLWDGEASRECYRLPNYCLRIQVRKKRDREINREKDMVLGLYGNSEHVAQAWRQIGYLAEKKNRFVSALDLIMP